VRGLANVVLLRRERKSSSFVPNERDPRRADHPPGVSLPARNL